MKILRFGLIAALASLLVAGCSGDDEPFGLLQEPSVVKAPTPMFNGVLPMPPATVVALTADGPDENFDLDVGTVTITNDANNLFVAIEITDLDWCVVQAHVDMAATAADIPQTKKGNPSPGQFAYSATYPLDFPCEQSPAPFVIPLTGFAPGDALVVAVHTEVVSAIDECYETVWQIGDVEVVNATTDWLENYADEFNWGTPSGPTTAGPNLGTEQPGFADPFIVGTTPTAEFPYNSNYNAGYANDFDVQWSGGLPFGGKLTVSWSPGQSATEKKVVSDGFPTTTWTQVGSPSPGQGYFLDRYPLAEDYVDVNPVADGTHTVRFQHTQGDGTFWDWVLLEKPCERNETAWAEGAQFDGNNWGMYIPYVIPVRINGDLGLDRWKIDGVSPDPGPDSQNREVEFLAFYINPTTETGMLYWDQDGNGQYEHIVAIDAIALTTEADGLCAYMSGVATTSTSRQGDTLNIIACDLESGDSYANYWTEADTATDEALWEYTINSGDIIIGF